MKILAIEKEINDVNWNHAYESLRQEARFIYDLQKRNIIREIYFNDQKCAVIIFECKDTKEAEFHINSFPLVKDKYIRFELHELHAYTGFERLFNSNDQ